MSQHHDRRAAAGQAHLALKAVTLGFVAAALAVPAATAHAATTEFSSSFEASDRPLDWTSTAETDAPLMLDVAGMTKGQIYINNRHLGRYFVATATLQVTVLPHSFEFEGEEVTEEEIESKVSEFKQFLEQVTPDEFAVDPEDE